MILDIISDIHLDFYARFNKVKTEAFAKWLINSKTNKNFEVLIIAGDIGHYNDDNLYLIELLSEFYEKIKNLDYADIIVSHIPPINITKIDIGDNYYVVPYGEEVIEKVKPKMWIFDNIRSKIYKKFSGCKLICNPLGYPEENEKFVIESIEVN